MSNQSPSSERRSFLALINAGAAAVAALAAGGVARAQAKAAAPAPFAPALHPQDDWMDQIPGKHRLIIDTSSPDGFKDGLQFANNFLTANRTGYGLESKDLAIIVVARHLSAGYGFNNEMWAKYGASLAGSTPSADAQTPKSNPNATTLTALSSQGVQVAVCALSARRIAGTIARSTGGNTDEVLIELGANLAKNARMVPAGIVALNRAQERGYTLARA